MTIQRKNRRVVFCQYLNAILLLNSEIWTDNSSMSCCPLTEMVYQHKKLDYFCPKPENQIAKNQRKRLVCGDSRATVAFFICCERKRSDTHHSSAHLLLTQKPQTTLKLCINSPALCDEFLAHNLANVKMMNTFLTWCDVFWIGLSEFFLWKPLVSES